MKNFKELMEASPRNLPVLPSNPTPQEKELVKKDQGRAQRLKTVTGKSFGSAFEGIDIKIRTSFLFVWPPNELSSWLLADNIGMGQLDTSERPTLFGNEQPIWQNKF